MSLAPRAKSRSAPYLSALCALAIPVMLEQLGQILLGTVDTFFAGQIGDNAIAAVNVTNMFMNLFATVFTSLGIGIMVMISHALGEKMRRWRTGSSARPFWPVPASVWGSAS